MMAVCCLGEASPMRSMMVEPWAESSALELGLGWAEWMEVEKEDVTVV